MNSKPVNQGSSILYPSHFPFPFLLVPLLLGTKHTSMPHASTAWTAPCLETDRIVIIYKKYLSVEGDVSSLCGLRKREKEGWEEGRKIRVMVLWQDRWKEKQWINLYLILCWEGVRTGHRRCTSRHTTSLLTLRASPWFWQRRREWMNGYCVLSMVWRYCCWYFMHHLKREVGDSFSSHRVRSSHKSLSKWFRSFVCRCLSDHLIDWTSSPSTP